MKRQLTFNKSDGKYVICEQQKELFIIDPDNMRFDSLKFYNGIYKSMPCNAAIECSEDIDSRGRYIFNWLHSIIQYITENCGEPDDADEGDQMDEHTIKEINLFDLPACAGDGNYVDSDAHEKIKTNNTAADFAVKISGHSMEPDYPDQCVVLVKQFNGEELEDGEAYIIELEGDVLFKRFKKLKRGANFVSDNADKSYKKLPLTKYQTATSGAW